MAKKKKAPRIRWNLAKESLHVDGEYVGQVSRYWAVPRVHGMTWWWSSEDASGDTVSRAAARRALLAAVKRCGG